MNNTATRNERIAPQQLTLLSDSTLAGEATGRTGELRTSNAPAQFRLSKKTREIGLAHVAEIRQQLAAAQARREAEQQPSLPRRSQRAA